MNYPLWDLAAPGLLIAFIAVVHVFVSHFAVGGGLFLVLTEWKARRQQDGELLDWLRRHSRFFILLTLVFGAVTGVGIWFTIGLIHPAATSSLINTFVWGWAIEWCFFLIEIAAAIVYFYGWDRFSPRLHMTIGWIYFVAAWASLVVINGILTFMLTPGSWLETHSFWQGYFNPTYWPSLVIRTLGAVGLAGVYALFTASWLASPGLARRLSRYAALGWVLPMAIGMPLALFWYFTAAGRGGIPVGEILGASSSGGLDLIASLFTTPQTGHPVTQLALRIVSLAALLTAIGALAILALRRSRPARLATGIIMLLALVSVGSAEWVREGLRKPYVIGSYMFVSGVRMPPPDGSPAATLARDDPFRIDNLTRTGVLAAAPFRSIPDDLVHATELTIDEEKEAGREVYRLLCSECHTLEGYVAIAPLVRNRSSMAIEGMIDRLALPKDAAGQAATWSTPGVRLDGWKSRSMPPFPGNERERRLLAVYLASVGGGEIAPAAPDEALQLGAGLFEANCGLCHGEGTDWPLEPRLQGKSEEEIFEILGRLPDLNEAMPPFEGTDEERRDLTRFLKTRMSGGAA